MKKTYLMLLVTALFSFSFASAQKSSNKIRKKWKAEHVIFIGLDGWGAYNVDKYKTELPNINALMESGSYTLQKRSVLPSSSAVNWASMFMGAGPELHGYTNWGTQTPTLKSRELNENGMFPNMFQLLRKADPNAEIGMIYEWDGIKYLIDSLSHNYYEQASAKEGNHVLRDMAVSYIKNKKPNFAGFIFDSPDDVGHAAGHDTPEYYAQVKVLDSYVGDIINAVKEAGIYDKTIIIVTSDHGGIDKGHGSTSMMEMETPFIISGKGIKNGGEFFESVMQYDVAPTIADIFNLPKPQVWVGRSMKQVFK